ncbi:cytochrome P450 [Streptomyces sp. NRRL S-1868]|uniref:cytochrome P450 n=1 Tax=Streptomyces sp. NRRL S-1868 TaxID=1463892 RepID=UPI00068DA0A0|nr:cytochrome P450 [Streptomyces sp. NRRL S-1868]
MTARRVPEPVAYPFHTGDGLGLAAAYREAQRTAGPIRVQLPYGEPAWLVTRYAEARAVLADHRFSRAMDAVRDAPRTTPVSPIGLVATDPPEHTRLRRPAARAFTARRAERLRPRVREIAEAAAHRLAAQGPPADLVEGFALPVPIAVICELLGVPAADRDRFRGWSDTVLSTSGATREDFGAATGELKAFMAALLAQRRTEPADDLLTALLHARAEDAAPAASAATAVSAASAASADTAASAAVGPSATATATDCPETAETVTDTEAAADSADTVTDTAAADSAADAPDTAGPQQHGTASGTAHSAAHGTGDAPGTSADDELVELCIALLLGGYETTAAQLANFTWVLLTERPEVLPALADSPGSAEAWVEELLRYVPLAASASLPRYATEDVEVGGVRVRAGEPVLVAIGAADRDGLRYPRPDDLDPGRDAGGHLAFGHGIHHCAGAALARVELQEGLRALARVLPGLRPAGAPTWRTAAFLRGPAELPVRW